jgi:GT2 family glycosyltransferase
MAEPLLSVIIVSWNVRALLAQALRSLLDSWGQQPGLEIIVVDNASHDGTCEMLREAFPQVQLIASDQNLGFTRGNNRGLEQAHGRYLLLLNPDTEIRPGALAQLIDYLQTHPQTGMVGPQLLNSDGSLQPSRRRFPTLPILFLESTWLQGLAPRRLLRHFYLEDRPADQEQEVDWITGAAMLIPRPVLEQVGGLDEGFFMYSEELDWCRRIRAAGWTIAYLPTAQIVHHEGKSSEQVTAARHIYFQSSKVRYTRKYHGPLAAETLRLWLLSQYLWQFSLEGLKALLGHHRPLRLARMAAYRQVLATGLKQPRPPDPA